VPPLRLSSVLERAAERIEKIAKSLERQRANIASSRAAAKLHHYFSLPLSRSLPFLRFGICAERHIIQLVICAGRKQFKKKQKTRQENTWSTEEGRRIGLCCGRSLLFLSVERSMVMMIMTSVALHICSNASEGWPNPHPVPLRGRGLATKESLGKFGAQILLALRYDDRALAD